MRQLEFELNMQEPMLEILYRQFRDEGMTALQIDAIFEDRYGVDNATETYDD